MGKARTGLYEVKGDALTRTHKFCPKCGTGIVLAEHEDRRSCGRCGYAESKTPSPAKPKAAKPKGPAPKAATPPSPPA